MPQPLSWCQRSSTQGNPVPGRALVRTGPGCPWTPLATIPCGQASPGSTPGRKLRSRRITSQGQVIHKERVRNKVIPWRFLPGRSRRRMTKIIQKNILAFLLYLTENKTKAWTKGRNSVSESPGIAQVDREL